MIKILPDTEGRTLVIQASEKLTTRDYEDVFIPKLNQIIAEHGKISVVFYLDETFEGWEAEAMWDDAKFGLKHRKDLDRVAVVGGPNWFIEIAKLGSHFFHCEIKTFDKSAMQEAIAWAKQPPK